MHSLRESVLCLAELRHRWLLAFITACSNVVASRSTSLCFPEKQHGRSTWRSVWFSVPRLASPLMAPHLPCNITNGGDRCSQLLHPVLQLATVQGASWFGRSLLVLRCLHKASPAPHTGQRSESYSSRVTLSSSILRNSFSCPASQCSSVVRILVTTTGIESERSKQAHTIQGYIPCYTTTLVEGEGTDDVPVSLMHPAVGPSLTPL